MKKSFTQTLKNSPYCFFTKLLVLFLSFVSFTSVFAGSPGGSNPFAVTITQQPIAARACNGGNASFSVVATGSGVLSYQWQRSTNSGGTWSNLSNGGIYTGATTANLALTGVTASMDNNQFRCVVSDGTSATSTAALLTVNIPPTVQTLDVDVQVCISGSVSITASLYAGVTYQWQVNTGSGFSNIIDGGVYTGATTNMLRITNTLASMEGYLYRYIATNTLTSCSATSALDILHVLPYASISQQPVSATACPGNNTSFTVAATGAASIRWQVSTNGSVWTDVVNNAMYSGATSSTLSITGATVAMNNFRYRVILNNTLNCSIASNTVFLFVRTNTAITTQPVAANVCAASNVNFSVVATGSTLTYQWQTDNGSNGNTWSNVSTGGTSAMLTVSSVTMAMNGYRYRVNVTGYCGAVTSSEATLQTTRSGTWLGVTNTDWHTASNWCGGVPVSTTDVLIPNGAPNMPTISAGVGYSRNIIIQNNAKLTISGGSTSMTGPFTISGTVAYTATADQPVLPASHGSLEIHGSGSKFLQVNTDVYKNLVLDGNAKLVTGNFLITMKEDSNPITLVDLSTATNSWIVTGNGSSGAANTGLGGLQIERLKNTHGHLLLPIGPTTLSYNPAQLDNHGAPDDFIINVNDQPIPGALAGVGITRTWKITEARVGNNKFSLNLKWNTPEEQIYFDVSKIVMVRSENAMLVKRTAVANFGLNQPLVRRNSTDLEDGGLYSLISYNPGDYALLPVQLESLTVKKTANTASLLEWKVTDQDAATTYVVQRSVASDNNRFVDIGTVGGQSTKTKYSFTDHTIVKGMTYYRLKMISGNQSAQFSKIVSINHLNPKNNYQLRPTVIDQSFTHLLVSLEQKENLSISLCNAAGVLQWNKSIAMEKGEHDMNIDVSRLTKGVYFLRVTTSGNTTVLPMIKQ